MRSVTVKKISEIIRNNKSFLITAHVNLEGDALGSELAVYALLKKLGKKKVVICNNDTTPMIYDFLPSVSVIRNNLDAKETFDVALALDCSDSSRAGKVKDYLSRAKYIVNIDHHVSNTFFGDFNWIDPQSGSTCQMLYQLCNKFKVINDNIALCLYTGIFTDTGKFTYSNTTQETHRIVTELMAYNVHPNKIYDKINSLCDAGDLSFIGRIISSLKFDSHQKVCWAVIKDWQEKGYDLTEVVFSIMRLLKDVEVVMLFRQLEGNKVRVNFRSRHYVDVNRIAKFFGGGGHKRASATTMEDTLDGAEKKVITFVHRYVNGNK